MRTLNDLPSAADILMSHAEDIDHAIASAVSHMVDQLYDELDLGSETVGQFHENDAANQLLEELQNAIMSRMQAYVEAHC